MEELSPDREKPSNTSCSQDFQPEADREASVSLEEFFLLFAQLALHIVRLETVTLRRCVEDTEIQIPDPTSRPYLQTISWYSQVHGIPFFIRLLRLYGSEFIANLVARINDGIAGAPIDALTYLSEYAACILALLPRCPALSWNLIVALSIADNVAESRQERLRFRAAQELVDSPVNAHALKHVFTLVRAIDIKYQEHISKKLSWVTGDTSDSILRLISQAYHSLCRNDQDIALQLVKDLAIDLPENVSIGDYPSIVYWAWRFILLKKHIMDGRMELRVHGMETMQNDLVSAWRTFVNADPPGSENLTVQFLLEFLRKNKIVEYVVGVDSHPQLISRSGNIVGFLIVTAAYTDKDTDTIWRTVTESQDPRSVSEVLTMLSRTIPMHQASSNALLYLSSKLLDLPLSRFDSRMLEFCEHLFHHVREKYSERGRYEQSSNLHVDTVPLRLCVRLIRESAVSADLSVDHKALLQRFASSQLSLFINVGLSDMDRTEMYELCIRDIAEMNQFSGGSMQALNALLPPQDTQEIRKLSTDFDLTSLVINEFARAIASISDFTDPFSRNGFMSRIHLLNRILDKVPDTISPELSDTLWTRIFMSRQLAPQGRSTLWDMLCRVTNRSMSRNPFIELCIGTYLPQLSPEDYAPEILAFAKNSIVYEARFNPPATVGENVVISIPGMDRIWTFILSAPPGTIETDATNFAIDVYLDNQLISRAPRSSIEATHISIVDRCVEQLKAAASKLKAAATESMGEGQGNIQMAELRFSRTLLFLRQLLQGLRARPQYSPPQGSPPVPLEQPVKGAPVDISYQSFDGGNQSGVSTLRIGDLSTASELVERLTQITGFSKFTTIYGGQKVSFLDDPGLLIRDMKVRPGLLIVRKVPDSLDFEVAKRKSQTPVDAEVLKYFDDLYDLLNLEDHLARQVFFPPFFSPVFRSRLYFLANRLTILQIYEFLTVFPPQERIKELVKSESNTDGAPFSVHKPFNFLYSLNALSACIRQEALSVSALPTCSLMNER